MIYRKEDILKFMNENPRATLSDLAKAYGISKQGIHERLRSMGINWNELKNESRKNQILQYISKHPDTDRKQMARALNISYEILGNDLKRYGINLKEIRSKANISRTKLKRKEVEKFLEENPKAKIKDLAEYFKVHYQTMLRYLKNWKICVGKPKIRVPIKWDGDDLRNYIAKYPFISKRKLAEEFKVSVITMDKYLDKYGIELKSSRKKREPLTKERLEPYIKLHPEDSLAKIGKAMGYSSRTVGRYLVKYNLYVGPKRLKPRVSPEVVRKYVEEHPEAIISSAARDLGVCNQTLYRYLNKLGIKLKNNNTKVTNAELKRYVEENPKASCNEIAQNFDINVSTVRKKLRELKRKAQEKDKVYPTKTEKVENIDKKQEMLLKVIEMLKSIHGLSVERLQVFLAQKGIDVSKEEILKYQHELQKEKEEER